MYMSEVEVVMLFFAVLWILTSILLFIRIEEVKRLKETINNLLK